MAGLCPAWPLRHYTAAQLLRVAAEMTDLRTRDPDAETPRVVDDLRVDRARRRAVCGED